MDTIERQAKLFVEKWKMDRGMTMSMTMARTKKPKPIDSIDQALTFIDINENPFPQEMNDLHKALQFLENALSSFNKIRGLENSHYQH